MLKFLCSLNLPSILATHEFITLDAYKTVCKSNDSVTGLSLLVLVEYKWTSLCKYNFTAKTPF